MPLSAAYTEHEFSGAEPHTRILFLSCACNAQVFFRKDTRKEFQWRVRNIPYEIDVYSLTVNDEGMAVRILNRGPPYHTLVPTCLPD